MGIFDKNIHMNGSRTTYQAFLDLADAAEEKGGTIGDRTVRLVKAGDGLATTTSLGTKGARADQIAGARAAFLQAIAREYGYAARNIALKTLGDGENSTPLTARSIRAVNEALGDKDALAADSALIRQFKLDFDVEIVTAQQWLEFRMGATGIKLDYAKVQAEVLKLLKEGKYPNTQGGMKDAIRDVAAQRVAVAMQMESLFRARGVPEYMVPRLAAMVLDKAMAIVDDTSVRSGDDVIGKLHTLATNFAMESKDFIDRCNIAEATANEAENLLKTMFGPNALDGEDAAKALENLKSKLDKLQDKKMSMEEFETECDNAFKLTVKAHIVRQIGMEMMLANSSASYGRMGVRLYDALGVGNGENDRAIDDFCILKMPSDKIKNYAGLDAKSPEELRRQAATEIESSALDPAQKKAFLAKVMAGNVDVTHVKIALKTVTAFDAKELVDAAKAGDGKKLAEQLFQFVVKTNAMITDKAEFESVKGADDYTAFVATATDLPSPYTRRSRTAPGDSTPARARNCSTMPWRRRSTSRVNSRIETGTDLPSCRSWPWGWKRGTGRRLPHASCS